MEHVQREDAFSADYAKPHISGVASLASDRREGSGSHEEDEVGFLPVAGLCKVRDQPLEHQP